MRPESVPFLLAESEPEIQTDGLWELEKETLENDSVDSSMTDVASKLSE